ncbi:hypothetical protein ACHAPT_009255 [Fusarium lateritium]
MADTPSSTDVASTVGTWIAVVVAIVALISIIAPCLLFRAAHTERSQALNAVDDADTGYVTQRLRLTENIHLHRVQAPLLDQPPTGGYGDSLHIRRGEAWFPIHRLHILGIGLRGRYEHRKDRGESRAAGTRPQLLTEGDIKRNKAYETSLTAEVLYGPTGTLWWRQTLNGEAERLDELYFAPHRYIMTMEELIDTASLQELFWLSIGCLPLTYRRKKLVLDLDYEPADISYRTYYETEQGPFKFWKCELSPRVLNWADVMGISRKDIDEAYYLKPMSPLGAEKFALSMFSRVNC